MSSANQSRTTTQSVVQTHMERRPSTFLSLAPETSASYPTTQSTAPGLARRSSSLGSQSSAGSLRFLKLGPVHWGEHQGEHKDDFHEVAVE
ncbi:Uu.00g029540.m01.CDS01 [Anthostomella pinea]|uniref:Uu.00g029540.m01.CDS01 n=1 Tax=Anthostomella pinea TaxID=933095 RepID=A0AAI8YCT6_9PEZI|nr:Uu.00g029540.m01.CDS01 [Anthostomella pinea]